MKTAFHIAKQLLILFWLTIVVLQTSALVQAQSTLHSNSEEQFWSSVAQNQSYSVEQRRSALQELSQYYGANSVVAIARASRDPLPEIRAAAVDAVAQWGDTAKWDIASPLLNDSNPKVRERAVMLLLPLKSQLNAQQWEYLSAKTRQHLSSSSPKGSVDQVKMAIAIEDYEVARQKLELVELKQHNPEQSLLLRSEIIARELGVEQSIEFMQEHSHVYISSAPFHYQLGLLNVRLQQQQQAEIALYKAHRIEPQNTGYLLALASIVQLRSDKQAVPLFEKLYQLEPHPGYLFAACNSRLKASMETSDCKLQLAQIDPNAVEALYKTSGN